MENGTSYSHTNSLIHESSPYLLQHAHNPVNWMPWGEEALALAIKENKPIIISIGYSACHWCHVMEEESFENDDVAEIMNKNFICIKVDREERPDIDQIYMNAVQLMTGRGGWPLNCITTPDGRPFYGGTYFPKSQWLDLLQQLQEVYTNDLNKVVDYANKLTEGIQQTELIKKQEQSKEFEFESLQNSIEKWKQYFDVKEGGESKSPKFPMPNNYQFLLHYFYSNRDQSILKHLEKSLQKMAFGGIYDQIGGGFARYSTDEKWKVPHFEKMLYDNAQLVSLYSEAYRLNKNPHYKEVVYETLKYINDEMTAENGAFYSALDADSEGMEGKYYVWKKEELEEILENDFPLFADYFNINNEGYWEDGNYILLRKKTNKEFVSEHNLESNEFKKKVSNWKSLLWEHRQKRTKPGLDDKTLTSWNALMIKGYVDAYKSFSEDTFLEAAIKNGNFLINNLMQEDGRLHHSYKSGKASLNAFLEDYSFSIEAFLALYEVTFNENWLLVAKNLAEYTFKHFFDKESAMFFFTSDKDLDLIARKTEIADNVIPSSNSSMAKALFILSKYLEDVTFEKVAKQMVHNMEEHLLNYPQAYTNWGIIYLNYIFPFYEIAIVGEKYNEKAKELFQNYLPNSLILGGTKSAKLSLLKNKYTEGKTKIFVCENKVCQSPVIEVTEALKQIDQH